MEIDFKKQYNCCVETTKKMLEIQKENVVKTNSDRYSIGLYNGIALCYAMLTLTEPEYYKEDENG